MANPKKLSLGTQSSSPTPSEEKKRIEILRATIEHYLPDFAKGVTQAASEKDGDEPNMMIIHQDAFAAGYHDDEYTLLGMAIKYAGLRGVHINLIGTNHETF